VPKRQRAKASEVLAAAEVEARSFDLSELAHAFVSGFGGVEAFASACMQEYRASKPGTIARYKLLDSMTRIIVRAAEKAAPQTEAGNLSDEELHEALVSELKRRHIVVEESDEQPQEEVFEVPGGVSEDVRLASGNGRAEVPPEGAGEPEPRRMAA
jgi:hypothetical protein